MEKSKKSDLGGSGVSGVFEGSGASRGSKGGPKKSAIAVFLIGVAAVIVGVVILLLNVFSKPGLRDAEFLVEVGTWAREDAPTVIWEFTEVGEGVLTTNAHLNDYDFRWALEGEKLKIETDWLVLLEDEYDYRLDQGAKILTLANGEESFGFVSLEEKAE